MAPTIYYTATTLDGYIADPDHSLAWLLKQDIDEDGPFNFGDFNEGIGALVMGSSTYEWILRHQAASGEAWAYKQLTWVLSSRDLGPAEGADIRFARGDVRSVHAAAVAAAGGKSIWVVGGGDLAGQFADAGLLDEVIVSVAPVTLGAGAPLLPRRLDLRLIETARNEAFVCARYKVLGPLA